MTERPFVSVIVPVYNDTARLQLCLAALEAQTYPSDRYEVIVVDNASDVPVAPVIERYAHALSVLERRTSAYAARNTGLSVARGEIIGFTDSDCLPASDWLAQGVAALGDDYDMAGGWIETVPRDAARPTMVERYALFLSSRQQTVVLGQGEAATGNMFARRSVLGEVGPFDASFRSGSDYQWCRRARAMGKRFVAATEACVRHPARRTLREIGYRHQRFMGGQYLRARQRGRWAVIKLAAATLRTPLREAPSILRGDAAGPSLHTRLAVLMIACYVSGGRLRELTGLILGLIEPKR